MSSKFTNKCDDMLLGSIMGWLLEASDDYKVDLSHEELTKLTSFVYQEAVEKPLAFHDAKYLAFNAVRIKVLVSSI